MCSATIWGPLPADLRRPDALVCVATGPHQTHTFESTSVDDGRHNDDASQEDA